MTQIMELMEKRAKAWEAAKAFLNSHSQNGGMVSAEDAATYDKMEKEVTDLTHDIERLQRQEQIDKMMSAPTSAPLTGKPGAKDEPEDKPGIASKAYKAAFWNNIRKRNYYDVKNVLEVGTDANGGYLVPDEYEKQLIDALQDENFFRSLATVIQTQSGTHTIPVVASHGTAAWMDENGLYPESDDTFDQISLSAYKLGTAIKVSEELMNDSAFDLESYIASEFARKISDAEEEAFITGSGTGKPFGILHDKEGAEVGITAAAANAITTNELIDLYYSLRSPYRKRAVWIMNDATVNMIRKLKDGNGQYIWSPGITANDTDTILGRKVYTTTCMPTVKTGAKTVAFGDLDFYWIGDREGISFKRLNELYATKGQVGFLATKRLDARLILPETIKVLKMK